MNLKRPSIIEDTIVSRGFKYEGNFIKNMTNDVFNAGCIKFNIPTPYECESLLSKDDKSCNGEGVWGWVNPEDKKKWNDDSFTGEISAVLLNDPVMNFVGSLFCGMEVKIACNGSKRPVISPRWVKDKILDAHWYKE